MAKATAKCICSKCGATFVMEATRNSRKECNSWEEWAVSHYDTCLDCYKKEQEEKTAKIVEEAIKSGLPALVGSEKQVKWAFKIRSKFIDFADRIYNKYNSMIDENSADADELRRIVNLILLAKKKMLEEESASKWIDKESSFEEEFMNLVNQLSETETDSQENETSESKESDEIVPENQQHGTVQILVSEDKVSARYPKDDTFRSLIKEAGYSWSAGDICWYRKITKLNGPALDRAAELANKLLLAGFAVKCKDAQVRKMALDASFEPECDRWITACVSGSYAGWLAISLGKDKAMYNEAKKIKGAKYSSGNFYAPVAKYQLVIDYAEMHGYKFSDGAKELIAEYEATKKAKPAKAKKPEEKNKLKEILESDDTVLADLRDNQ